MRAKLPRHDHQPQQGTQQMSPLTPQPPNIMSATPKAMSGEGNPTLSRFRDKRHTLLASPIRSSIPPARATASACLQTQQHVRSGLAVARVGLSSEQELARARVSVENGKDRIGAAVCLTTASGGLFYNALSETLHPLRSSAGSSAAAGSSLDLKDARIRC
jgi:hypothetical protein